MRGRNKRQHRKQKKRIHLVKVKGSTVRPTNTNNTLVLNFLGKVTKTCKSKMSADEFINAIKNKQLENSLKLGRQTTIKINNKTFSKKSITAKQWRELVVLNQKVADGKTELDRSDALISLREKGALYYFGIPPDIFDINYEKISPIVEGAILRSNMGANTDVEFEELLKRFEKYNNLDDVDVDVNGANKNKISPPKPKAVTK